MAERTGSPSAGTAAAQPAWTVNAPLPSLVWVKSAAPAGTILVSLADRRLYRITEPGNALSYPIAIPSREHLWNGTLKVTDKRPWPRWRPTASMLADNPALPREVEGGSPENPLGARALYLGSTTYRIHGTDAPWTIGHDVSVGCIRMFNEHVIELYDMTTLGASVTVTDESLISDVPLDAQRALQGR